jgi:HAE1 family hydrophobic/amphiphilic exporter-1
MFLSNFSVRRPVVTLVILLMLMATGLLALKKLKVNQNPDVALPLLSIDIAYPGASPETVEREVLNRIEKSLNAVTGIKEIKSTANDSRAQLWVFFNFNKNMVEASDEVRNAIGSVRYKLPAEIREPVVLRIDPSQEPAMQLALSSSTQSHVAISRLAEDKLADQFRAIPGVSQVKVTGALRRELSVLLHAQKLREANLSVAEVVTALRNQNMAAPVGKIRGELEDQSIRLLGRIESPAAFRDIVIRRNGTETTRLGQVATIEDGLAEPSDLSFRNGQANVGLAITRSREASTVTVADEVRQKVSSLNASLPEGTRLVVTQDGGKDAQSSLNNVIEALGFGAILTIFVVYVFLNSWRSTLITALSLPTSVVTAFIAVWLCGFTLNFMSLLGLSLAIGVLIDDAIVVRENIVRHMERGLDRRTAALQGTAEIGMAVAATTFSIVAVFIPVAFMPGVSGEWFRPFGLTVVASVLVSLLISFTLDPMLSAYWGDPTPTEAKPPARGLGLYLTRFNTWFDAQAERYGRLISWALQHRRSMATLALLCLLGAVGLHARFGGSSFLPSMDGNTLAIEVRTPSSTSLEYARRKLDAAARLAHELPETVATNSQVNPGGGRIYVDIGESSKRQRTSQEIGRDLRSRMAQLVGAEYVVMDDLNNGPSKPVQIRFYGSDSRQLLTITQDFMAQLRQVPGAVDVGLSQKDPQKELQIELDRGLANALGITAADVTNALRVAFAGIEVGDWVDPTGESRDVAIRLAAQDRADASQIERLPITVSGMNTVVPLGQIAKVSMGFAPSSIEHANGKRTMAVSANVQGRAAGEVTQDALKLARSISFPEGFGLELAGASRDQQEVFTEMGIALVSGIGLMYLILVMQFGSFTAPVAVMLSLPLSLIGVVLALLMTGGTLNLMSFIGVIMLMGLVAKNAILLLDAARELEKEGMDREAALVAAGRKRLRPILMTTMALIAGMLPVAIGMGDGGEFYRPMAVAIIGGTITSTVLTLLVVPSFYDSIEVQREASAVAWQQRHARHGFGLALLITLFSGLASLLLLRLVHGLGREALQRWRAAPR